MMRMDGKHNASDVERERNVNAVVWKEINRNVRKSIVGMKG